MSVAYAEDYYIRILFSKMKVEDIMTTVNVVRETDDFSRVVETFIINRTPHVCIVDQDFRLTGLISQKYLYRTRSPIKVLSGQRPDEDADILIDGDAIFDKKTLNQYSITEVMNPFPHVLKPEDSVAKALTDMVNLNLDCIPVVNERYKPVGFIKEKNIIKFLAGVLFEE